MTTENKGQLPLYLSDSRSPWVLVVKFMMLTLDCNCVGFRTNVAKKSLFIDMSDFLGLLEVGRSTLSGGSNIPGAGIPE